MHEIDELRHISPEVVQVKIFFIPLSVLLPGVIINSVYLSSSGVLFLLIGWWTKQHHTPSHTSTLQVFLSPV